MSEIKEGSRVVVKSFPIEEIIGLTGTVEHVKPTSHYTKNMVKLDIPLDPSGCEYFWFADEDLEVIE